MPAETKPVTLEWHVAHCDECAWESNPTPDEDHARDAANHHNAEVHGEAE